MHVCCIHPYITWLVFTLAVFFFLFPMAMTASHLGRLRSILPFHEIGSADSQSVVVDQRLSDVIVRKLCRIHLFSQTCCYYVEPVSAVVMLMYGRIFRTLTRQKQPLGNTIWIIQQKLTLYTFKKDKKARVCGEFHSLLEIGNNLSGNVYNYLPTYPIYIHHFDDMNPNSLIAI